MGQAGRGRTVWKVTVNALLERITFKKNNPVTKKENPGKFTAHTKIRNTRRRQILLNSDSDRWDLPNFKRPICLR